MLKYTDLKKGVVFIMEGHPYEVLEYNFLKLHRGKPVVQAKIKNLKTGAIIEKTFNTNIKFEKAMINKMPMQYLYQTGEQYYFMNMETYEQIDLSEEQIGENKKYLKEGLDLNINFYEGEVIEIQLPEKISYKVVETESATKGNTVNNANKEAKLENGLVVKVPMFIKNDDLVLISTKTGQYDSRA